MSKKYVLSSVEFRVHEDSYEHGEGRLMCIWSDGFTNTYEKLETALGLVGYFNELPDGHKNVWVNDPCHQGEFSRFDADVLIDWDFGKESPIMRPSEEVKELWKAGKAMLYNLHVTAIVKVITELAAEDVKDFKSAD